MDNIYKTLARAEAMAAAQRDEMLDVMQDAYQRACENEDAEGAAQYARKIRNKMLAESDKNMTFDRMGLQAPSGSTFTAWLSFLRGLGDVLGGAWAAYRQALRDLPEQEGFPFNIDFPQPPDGGMEYGKGFAGILKKVLMFCVVAVAHIVDSATGAGGVLRALTIGFLLANESISVLENCGRCGIPLPKKLLEILEQLKSAGEKSDNEDTEE